MFLVLILKKISGKNRKKNGMKIKKSVDFKEGTSRTLSQFSFVAPDFSVFLQHQFKIT